MEFRFRDRRLEELYSSGTGRLARRFPPEAVRAFFRVMLVIESAENATELRRFRGLRYHALRGSRTGQIALWLNDQFRLVVVLEKDELEIIEIVDYH